MNVQKTGDYELDHALFNWDSLTFLIKTKMRDQKKKRLTDYHDWLGCKYCGKIIPHDLWFGHKENCVRAGIFRMTKVITGNC